jgi:carbon-monoxide dehydrogenase medium subunit
VSLPRFELHEPETFDELFALAARYGEEARYLAGGTALVLLMHAQLLEPGALLALHRLPGLRAIARDDGRLRLGALATHAELAQSALLREHVPALAEAFAHVATPRIRNVGTVGGNLAHADPHQDPPVALMALGAAVVVRGPGGERRIPLDTFFTGFYETALQPGELITAVDVPVPGAGERATFIKFLSRSADDYATVNVAVALREVDGQVAEARIAVGCMGPTPFRVPEAEAVLVGHAPDERRFRQAGEAAVAAAQPMLDSRGSPAYKRRIMPVVVARAARQAWGAGAARSHTR